MKKLNNKGFSMVELLAVIVILGLMMGIAIPNIMGIIKKQKQSTYLEDAKKMISRAEYMVRSNTEVKKPANNNCIVMTLGYLDNGEFNSPPYGGAYFSYLSYVLIKNVNGKPAIIICNTIKGKGVSFMENKVSWHGKAPNEEQYNLAMEELNSKL